MFIVIVFCTNGSWAATYLDKCYCPGKDPYLNRAAALRNKMYELKTEYSSQQLEIKYRPGKQTEGSQVSVDFFQIQKDLYLLHINLHIIGPKTSY